MFEKLTLRRSLSGPAITAGDIAEALLFYQKVHLIINHGTLHSLITSIGAEAIINLLERSDFSAVYCEGTLATQTTQAWPFNNHSFTEITFTGSESKGSTNNKKKRLQLQLEGWGLNEKDSKIFAERFLLRVHIKSLASNDFIKGGVLKAALNDLDDQLYVHEAMRLIISEKIARPLGNFNFRPIKDVDKFYVASDLNYTSLQKEAQKYESTAEITEAHLLNEILEARSDMTLASHYGSEFYTASNTSQIIRLKYDSLLRRLEIETKEKSHFMDIVAEGRTIKEAIDSGEKSFTEFLNLLDKAMRFKEWTKNLNPDDKMVKEYLDEVTKKGWLEKLPAKSIRYALGGAIGAISAGAGLALSATDTFFLDKIKLGWRPNHFVDRHLKKFLNN